MFLRLRSWCGVNINGYWCLITIKTIKVITITTNSFTIIWRGHSEDVSVVESPQDHSSRTNRIVVLTFLAQSQGGVVVDRQDQLLLVLLLLTTLLIHHALAHAGPGWKELTGKYAQDQA